MNLLKGWEIDAKDITVSKIIGHGSFGIVHLGELHGMQVAIKKIAASASVKEKKQAVQMLNREVKTLSRCRHKNIVQLIGCCSNPPMLILAYAANGTLRDLLNLDIPLLPSRAMELIHGCCDGMAMLHSQNVLHLDLKPSNILIDVNGTALVADFGLAIAITATLTNAGSTAGGRGTMKYKAPEHFADGDSDSDEAEKETKATSRQLYDKPADVYSFAMLCWEIFSGVVPFAGKMDLKIMKMHTKALNGGKIKRPSLDDIPANVAPFIQACWAQDPLIRPTFVEVKEMLNAVGSVAVVGALNAPGYWYVFISHTQRNPEGKLLALDSHVTLEKKKKSSWLDVRMSKMDMAAMEEGVKSSSCVVAIITDSCVTSEDDPKKGGPEQNAYFNRWMCIQELRWAVQYNVPIQPVVRVEDKKKIGDFIQMAPDDLKFLGGIDWKHLDRGNKRFFDLGIDMVIEGVDELVEKMKEPAMIQLYEESRQTRKRMELATATSSGETKTTAAETYDIFLSHKQKDIDPHHELRIQDLAARMYENLKGRGQVCFLDKQYNGNSWNDLPSLVAHSKTVLIILSEKFVESPWCVLELLSAVMHKRPIAFLKVSKHFKLAALKKQFIHIGFPFVDVFDEFSVEIDYSEEYFDSAMNKVVERVEINGRDYPLPDDAVVTREAVADQYEELRIVRNEKFPKMRSWPSWGTDERVEKKELKENE